MPPSRPEPTPRTVSAGPLPGCGGRPGRLRLLASRRPGAVGRGPLRVDSLLPLHQEATASSESRWGSDRVPRLSSRPPPGTSGPARDPQSGTPELHAQGNRARADADRRVPPAGACGRGRGAGRIGGGLLRPRSEAPAASLSKPMERKTLWAAVGWFLERYPRTFFAPGLPGVPRKAASQVSAVPLERPERRHAGPEMEPTFRRLWRRRGSRMTVSRERLLGLATESGFRPEPSRVIRLGEILADIGRIPFSPGRWPSREARR